LEVKVSSHFVSKTTGGPSGEYKGSKTVLGNEMTADLNFQSASTLSISVDASSLGINFACDSESFTLGSDGAITLPGATTAGDCLKEGLDKYGVDLKTISYNSGSDSIDLSLKKSIINVDLTLNKVGSDSYKQALKSLIISQIANLKV
jgi:hypothetical protein